VQPHVPLIFTSFIPHSSPICVYLYIPPNTPSIYPSYTLYAPLRAFLHGDLKPLNVVRYDGRWRLIDLDCACDVGHPFGAKQPSTGYCPPEMARVVRDSLRGGAAPGRGLHSSTFQLHLS
jgi:hypothetical protein